MKIIQQKAGQRYFRVEDWLKQKGYRWNYDFTRLSDSQRIQGKWSQIYHLTAERGNYLIVRQKESPYQVWILDITGDLASPASVQYFLETGQQPQLVHFNDYIDEPSSKALDS